MDKQYQTHIDELLAKWLAGEATEAEFRELEAWQEASEENRNYIAQFETLWNRASESDIFTESTQKAWQEVRQQIKAPAEPTIKLKVLYRYATGIAATVAILLAGWWILHPKGSGLQNIPVASTGLFIQAGDSAYATTLPDQTLVILEPHSSITADTGFGKYNRTIRLKGNAWFKTRHGKSQVFTVLQNTTVIRDIGTAFWVYGNDKTTSVMVTEGTVQVLAFRDSALLKKGDSVIISRLEEKIQVISAKATQKAKEIKDKTLVFLKTELQKVTTLLNSTYHCDVRLGNPKIANCKLTATFNNEDLDTVLDVIRETFNLEIRRENNIIYLEGKGCQ